MLAIARLRLVGEGRRERGGHVRLGRELRLVRVMVRVRVRVRVRLRLGLRLRARFRVRLRGLDAP